MTTGTLCIVGMIKRRILSNTQSYTLHSNKLVDIDESIIAYMQQILYCIHHPSYLTLHE